MTRLTPVQGSILFFLLAPGTVAGLVPWLISAWRFQESFLGNDAIRFVGAALIFAGLDLAVDSFARFALSGGGTPAPTNPTRILVVSGTYCFVRNPMYIAVLGLVWGQALLFGDDRLLVYGLLLGVVFHAFVVLYEEPVLKRTFGKDFDAYRANVPRWIPRSSPWRLDAQA